MVSETKSSNGGNAGGGGFRAKMDHVLYSGEKKHVFAGILIIGAVFAVPWFLMTRGSSLLSLSIKAYSPPPDSSSIPLIPYIVGYLFHCSGSGFFFVFWDLNNRITFSSRMYLSPGNLNDRSLDLVLGY